MRTVDIYYGRKEMYFKSQLETLFTEMKSTLNAWQDELNTMQDGELLRRKRKGRKGLIHYYQHIRKTGNMKRDRYVNITNDRHTIQLLLRKRYLLNAVPALTNNLAALEHCIQNYERLDEAVILQYFQRNWTDLPDMYFTDNILLRDWEHDIHRDLNFYPDQLINNDETGVPVRSKNEIIIADQLTRHRIPFKTEEPLYIPEVRKVLHPDFTIRRPRDGKQFYWEHCGMVNNEQKIRGHKNKLDLYEMHRIVPWDNLIVTYDNMENGINARLIKSIIESVLL